MQLSPQRVPILFSFGLHALQTVKTWMFYFALIPLLVSCASSDNKEETLPIYKDASAATELRVQDLISRMTLSEKISQLYNEAPAIERLEVPYYDWWNEALHGVARAGKATVFPQAIGLAATFNKPLVFDVATIISDEARAKHHYFFSHNVHHRYTGLTFWSPNVNIFRDPRWGRGQETYGEDPYLTGTLAIEFIRGLQGNDGKYLKTSAMAKHFAVHSGPEKSRHSDNYHTTPKDLRETYLPAFEMAVKDANVESIMCAYNRVNDVPACGSEMLLEDILRDEWQFKGHVVSDCGALADFYDPNAHNVVPAPAQAAAWALTAGTDLNCGTGRLSTFANLHFALQRELVTEADIDQALTRLFTTRFKLGMFDDPSQVAYSKIPYDIVGSKKHLDLALQASEESFVLLKNNGILPLAQNNKIAVIGPNATNPAALVGNYHGDPIHPVTPLQGILNAAGKDNVFYAPGSAIVGDQYGHYTVVAPDYFFHQDNNKILPGLRAKYFDATTKDGIVGDPVMTRTDPNIDFFWQVSPLDQSVWDEFGVVWDGLIKVPTSGKYSFDGSSRGIEISIEGAVVSGPVTLEAGKHYAFSATTTYQRTTWGNNPLEPQAQVRWLNTSINLSATAMHTAKQADVIVFVAGISPDIEGEEMPIVLEGFDQGDRTEIHLPKPQTNLLKKLKTLGKPIILVNISGSAMALNWEHNNLDAILQGFYPGEATGTALANILFGQTNPSGKLPITFYKNLDGMPGFKDYAMTNRTYKFYTAKPLYAFGHGLSFSRFEFSNVKTKKASNDEITVHFDLTNKGRFSGKEVAQLYMELPEAAQHTAKRELIAYQKEKLSPGQTKSLQLTIPTDQISYVDNDGVTQIYTGKVMFSLGGGQPGEVGSSNVVEWQWMAK